MPTDTMLWQAFHRLNLQENKELIAWFDRVFAAALDGVSISNGTRQGVVMKIGQARGIHPGEVVTLPKDATLWARTNQLITQCLNGLQSPDGDVEENYAICKKATAEWLRRHGGRLGRCGSK